MISPLRHLVIVNDRAQPLGGASAVALRSAAALSQSGLHVTLFAGGSTLWEPLVAAGVDVVQIPAVEIGDGSARARAAIDAIWNREAESRLAGLLSRFAPSRTVVHVHSWSKALSPSVFAASDRSGAALVATLHDYGFVCPNAALHVFPTGKPCQLRPLSTACITCHCDARSRLHKAWRIARQISLERAAVAPGRVDQLIAVTEYAAEIYRPLLPADSPLVVLPNPIDVVDSGPATPAANSEVVFIGRISREKGPLLLAEAATRTGLIPIFVGDGELADAVRTMCPASVITGWLGRAGVTERLRRARAVVLPATWRETQGMVVPEAMANGIPVIVSSGTAPASAVLDGDNGIIFENGSVDALASALAKLADDAFVEKLGLGAYRYYWQAPSTMSRHIEGLIQIYADALSRRAARGSTFRDAASRGIST